MSQEDAAALLNEFVYQIDNLPAEVAFLLEEIGFKDDKVQDTRSRVNSRDAAIQKHHKSNGLLAPNPKEAGFVAKNRTDYVKLVKMSEEKVFLAEKGVRLLEKYVAKLDGEFERLKELGYNVGDAEAAHAAASAAATPSPALSGAMPQLDYGSANKKRKIQPMQPTGAPNSNMGIHQQAAAMNMNSPQQHHMQNYPYAANQIGTPAQGNMPYAAMQSPINPNSPYVPGMGQYNTTVLTPQQQQQFVQVYQNQYPSIGQLQNQAQQQNQSRPHRPSRLSSSFSAGGADANGMLPSNSAAYMPPIQSSSAAPVNNQAHQFAAQNAANLASNKRNRPIEPKQPISSTANRKKKKRIMISDEESGAGDATGEEDGEGEDEDADADGEEDKSILSRRAHSASVMASQKTGSRAGTPISNAPTPTSSSMPHVHKNKANRKGAAKAGSKKKDEEEEEDADAEGEEDWGAEADETNADDPTLYCFCHRVSYGNMIACDNPNCKYEWFHWACVKVTKQPDDNQTWYCPECKPLMQANQSTKANKGSMGSVGPYQQLQAQQQMMLNAQQAREGGGRSRRG